MPKPLRIEDHPAPVMRERPVQARHPEKEFKLKALHVKQKVNTAWVDYYMNQPDPKWLE